MSPNFNRIIFLCLLFVLFFVNSIKNVGSISHHPIVIVLAFDGFRFDYVDRGKTPILKKFRREGVRTDYLENVFPTKTYTNFFSIATGMYAETHGVLGNKVFDTNGECLNYSYELFHYNKDVLPIWTLNELTGEGRHSGTMMWVGSQYTYQNIQPTFIEVYNKSIPWTQRVDTMMTWILHKKNPVNLLYAYFEQPDSASHDYGIYSREVNEELIRMELILEYFIAQLEINHIRNKVNLIVLSDHGMTDIDLKNVINLNSFVDANYYEQCGTSPILQVIPKSGFEEEVYQNLSAAQNQLKTFTAYKWHEIPERWHYKNNNRTTDILLVADVPYAFDNYNKANHGYDNREKIMHAFFTAMGPLFRKNYYTKSLVNIDIYALITYVLKLDVSFLSIKPNSTLSNIIRILNDDIPIEYQSNTVQTIFKYFIPLVDKFLD